jgi:hypothetical protein
LLPRPIVKGTKSEIKITFPSFHYTQPTVDIENNDISTIPLKTIESEGKVRAEKNADGKYKSR